MRFVARGSRVLWSGFIISALWIGLGQAETTSQSKRAQSIASLIWQSRFQQALDSCHILVRQEPLNPLGYCLLGMTFHSIASQYRTDRYTDSITWNLDTAIVLAGAKSSSQNQESEQLFLLGSACGYRALEQSEHGSWFGALKDGHRSCVSLEKAYELDPSLTDAYLGIGDYHYWKSAKSKFFTWLPFVGDKRRQGIEEIVRAVKSGTVGSLSARKSLLPIYLNELRYEDVIALVDSLSSQGFVDPSCLLHKTKAEIELGHWDGASQMLAKLREAWEQSPFVDRCGTCEAKYLEARILAGRGDLQAARSRLQQILAMKDSCKSNPYFRESLSKATELLH